VSVCHTRKGQMVHDASLTATRVSGIINASIEANTNYRRNVPLNKAIIVFEYIATCSQ